MTANIAKNVNQLFNMEPTYYTPDISEFHIGFAFEVRFGGAWILFDWNESIAFDNVLEGVGVKWTLSEKFRTAEIRVKHLDRTDIEGVGWEYLTPICHTREGYSIIAQGDNFYEILMEITGEEDVRLFYGTILNKSELIFQMKRLNIKLNIKLNNMKPQEQIDALMGTIESQKQTFDALMKKYQRLETTFDEVLVEKFSIKELRDFWRERAGIIKQ